MEEKPLVFSASAPQKKPVNSGLLIAYGLGAFCVIACIAGFFIVRSQIAESKRLAAEAAAIQQQEREDERTKQEEWSTDRMGRMNWTTLKPVETLHEKNRLIPGAQYTVLKPFQALEFKTHGEKIILPSNSRLIALSQEYADPGEWFFCVAVIGPDNKALGNWWVEELYCNEKSLSWVKVVIDDEPAPIQKEGIAVAEKPIPAPAEEPAETIPDIGPPRFFPETPQPQPEKLAAKPSIPDTPKTVQNYEPSTYVPSSPRSTGPTYVGPRGGVYHYSKSGKKVYEKK